MSGNHNRRSVTHSSVPCRFLLSTWGSVGWCHSLVSSSLFFFGCRQHRKASSWCKCLFPVICQIFIPPSAILRPPNGVYRTTLIQVFVLRRSFTSILQISTFSPLVSICPGYPPTIGRGIHPNVKVFQVLGRHVIIYESLLLHSAVSRSRSSSPSAELWSPRGYL